MIRTLVIDDEEIIRNEILDMLSSSAKDEIVVVGDAGSVAEAITLAKACRPDLVLLDINLPDGTGFDFLEKVEYRNFQVVFITAYEEFALKAIKQGALDYLLKPVDEDELEEVLEKVIRTNTNDLTEQLDIVTRSLKGNNEKIVLRLFDSFQIIRFNELQYCKSDAGYTTFYLSDGRKFTTSKTIKEYESLLPSDTFFRSHQSYIINLDFIDRYEKSGDVILRGDINIPVSVRKRDTLVKLLS